MNAAGTSSPTTENPHAPSRPVIAGDAGVGPDEFNAWLRRAAIEHPTKPYVRCIDDGRELTYGQLHQLAGRIRSRFAALGVGPNERVVLLANNSLEHLAVYLGALASGVTICTVHVEANAGHLRTILSSLTPRLVIYDEGLGVETHVQSLNLPSVGLGVWKEKGGSGFFATLPAETNVRDSHGWSPENDAVIYFTSGTTAHPKGIVLTYREVLTNSAGIADGFGIRPDDRVYDYRSFNWASAQLLSALGPISKGATLLLRHKFSRTQFFKDISEHRATIAAGNPTVINMLLQGAGDDVGVAPPTLRFVISSSAPLLVDEWQRFEARFGVPVVQGYGTSETGWIAASRENARRIGTVGLPLPYHNLRILDPTGCPLTVGEVGSVEVGGFAGNAYRYIDDNGAVAVHSIGRIRTGDMGYLDADGYLHLTGRERDLIIRGGVNISPVEIDNILIAMDGIVEAVTIGVPDKIYGEEVVSYVVLDAATRVTPADILNYCTDRLPTFKAPKRIIVRDSLPKTDRGKQDRKALATEYLQSLIS
jgi:acyl-CoA synthetase (AMP-forming)/AMP-acid ligase II